MRQLIFLMLLIIPMQLRAQTDAINTENWVLSPGVIGTFVLVAIVIVIAILILIGRLRPVYTNTVLWG